MNGVSVYASRLEMGAKLAQKIMRLYPDHDINCVIPVRWALQSPRGGCSSKGLPGSLGLTIPSAPPFLFVAGPGYVPYLGAAMRQSPWDQLQGGLH